MKIDELLARLEKLKVKIAERRMLEDGRSIIILTSFLSFFPLKPHHRFYPLVLEKNQTEVDDAEVEAILRHFWHAEIDLFKT
jgi:hypothetical protein